MEKLEKNLMEVDQQKLEYSKRIEKFTQVFAKELRYFNLLSNLRIIVFILGLGLVLYLFLIKEYLYSGLLFSCFLLIFLILLIKHEKSREKCKEITRLIEINQNSVKRITGSWTEFPDTGEEFIDQKHPFTWDLDIFGQASLFQWINVSNTYAGRQTLSKNISQPEKNKSLIEARQKGIVDLAGRVDWRQQFQATGMKFTRFSRNPERLIAWSKEAGEIRNRYSWVIGLRILPIVTLLTLLLTIISPSVSYLFTLIPMSIQILLLRLGRKYIKKNFESISGYKEEISIYSELFSIVEREEFTADYLSDLRAKLFDESNKSASLQINSLSKIVEMMDLQYSPMFHLPFNLLVMWDYQCLLALEKWKRQSGSYFFQWLMVVGELEALASLAIIHYDHPDWVLPKIGPSKTSLLAKDLGHPLLTEENRVCNHLRICNNILIITGSNMSGKSTLLRTVGLNLVLAYTGAPVCSSGFQASLMSIYTSMRVNDNLEQRISSFYAELLRVKMVIEATKRRERVIFLLDEIFRGTNSHDRHLGAVTVLKNLSRAGAVGLVSTHDLELGDLEKESDLAIKNYHFQESYHDGQIYFDYILRPGVSTTSNAVYLMQMVGINLEQEQADADKT